MYCYFWDHEVVVKSQADIQSIQTIFNKIAVGTNTSDLVVSCYFLTRSRWYGGSAFVRNWFQPADFRTGRGKWKFTRLFPQPENLPPRFKLIRILILRDMFTWRFPLKIQDGYDWEFEYRNRESYLALLFAHELHHFRRFHLGLHPGEGEKSANRWALEWVQKLGFPVSGRAIRTPKPKRGFKLRPFFKSDPYAAFRTLAAGNQVFIRHDPRGKYGRKTAKVIRPIRANSKRISIQTEDNERWRWPMDWLEPMIPPKDELK
jgi:hypothetical protein